MKAPMRPRSLLAVGAFLSLVGCSSQVVGTGSPAGTPEPSAPDAPADDGTSTPPKKPKPAPPSAPDGDPVPAVDPSLDTGSDDPSLAAANRPSAPFECQGTPVTAAELIAYMPQGSSGFLVGGTHGSEVVLTLDEYDRQCTPATGCSAFSHPQSSLYSSYGHIAFRVTPAGEVYVVSPLWNSLNNVGIARRKLLTSAVDAQLPVRRLVVNSPEPGERMRIRATAAPNGMLCISAAILFPSVSGANGATTEGFAVGMANMYPDTRTTPAALDESPYGCPGALSSNAEIGTMFGAGQSSVSLTSEAFTQFTRSCHAVTGCTANHLAYQLNSFGDAAIVTSAAGGFAARFDQVGPSYAVTNGVYQVSADDHGSVRGACMDRRTLMAKSDEYGQADETLLLVKNAKP